MQKKTFYGRLSLLLENCCGKCYDGASDMAVCSTGVAIAVIALEQ